MSAKKWLSQTNPAELLMLFHGKAGPKQGSARLLRLAGCACGRQLVPLLRKEDAVCLRALAAAEAFADGDGDPAELARLADEVFPLDAQRYTRFPARVTAVRTAFRETLNPDPFTAAMGAAACAEMATGTGSRSRARVIVTGDTGPSRLTPVLADLLRDVLGNPFRPAGPVNPAWLTSTVSALANTLYADRAFERLPILADALEDAGCADADLLAHCRGPGPHALGCWALDLIRAVHGR